MSEETLQGLLDDAVASGAVPLGAVVVVDADGVRAQAAAGADPDAMFRFASMTKSLASAALLELLGEGEADLDTEVREVIPAFGELEVLEGFADDGTPRLRPPARQATLRHLLTHTAGHGYFFTNALLAQWHEATGVPSVLAGEKRALHAPLVHDPGEVWEYGINTDWVGQVAEALSGQDLGTLLRERFLGPLGMDDTTFEPTDAQRERLVPVFQRQADGTLAPSPHDLPPTSEWHAGGHGLRGTAGDYGKWVQALISPDGGGVLSPATLEALFTDHLQGAAQPELITSVVPDLINDVPALPVKQGWGCGLQLVLEDLPGMRRAGTGNWAGLFNSYYFADRATGVGMVLITQVLPFFDQRTVELALAIEATTYAELGVTA